MNDFISIESLLIVFVRAFVCFFLQFMKKTKVTLVNRFKFRLLFGKMNRKQKQENQSFADNSFTSFKKKRPYNSPESLYFT